MPWPVPSPPSALPTPSDTSPTAESLHEYAKYSKLVKKGQSADKTTQLFDLMHQNGIGPHVMMIHSDAQPLRSPPGDLSGFLNQARYVLERGAVSYQCTYLGPAVGTRDLEPALASGAVYRSVGGQPIPQALQDGNHVVASQHPQPWQRQLNLLRAYCSFYNPINAVRALFELRTNAVAPKRFVHQIIGHIGLLLTIPKLLAWAVRLRRGPIEVYRGLGKARIPMVDVAGGQEIDWAIQQLPSLKGLPGEPDSASRLTPPVVGAEASVVQSQVETQIGPELILRGPRGPRCNDN